LLNLSENTMSAFEKYIIIIGCFDTKAEVFAYLHSYIRAQSEKVITINTGVFGTTDKFHVDFEADAVSLEAGVHIADLRRQRDRGKAMDIMGKGAARIVSRLVANGNIKAAIGMGGGGGTYITLSAMQEIPLGIPKLCLTTLAAKDLSRQIGSKDITLVPSVVDVAGMNTISSRLIAQAGAAICAMANVTAQVSHSTKGSIAISMFGNTTSCVDKCTDLLQKKGYEVMAFHATGVGGRTMEALIREGCFSAVLDVTTTELADDLCGGICSAGPDRLTAAVEMGLPQVVVPGCLDMVNFAHPDTIPEQYRNRDLYSWAPDVTLLRTNQEENELLGRSIAQKLNRSAAPAAVVLPLRGISQIDAAGGAFYRPETDQVLFDSIKNNLNPKVACLEADAHINDDSFASLLVSTLLDLIKKAEG
jgi:uncharacterized protein (UPF0261 family)